MITFATTTHIRTIYAVHKLKINKLYHEKKKRREPERIYIFIFMIPLLFIVSQEHLDCSPRALMKHFTARFVSFWSALTISAHHKTHKNTFLFY